MRNPPSRFSLRAKFTVMSASAEQVRAQVGAAAASAQDLAGMASALRRVVEKFRL